MGDNEQVEHRNEYTNADKENNAQLERRRIILDILPQQVIPLFSGREFSKRGEPEITVEDWCDLVEYYMDDNGIQNQYLRLHEARKFIKSSSPAYTIAHCVIMKTWDKLKKELMGIFSIQKTKHPLDIAQCAFEINWVPGDDVINYYYKLIFIFESLISVLNELDSSEENKIPNYITNHMATLFIYSKLNNEHQRSFRKLWKMVMTSIDILCVLKKILHELESDRNQNARCLNGKQENTSNKANNFHGEYRPKGNSNFKKQENYEFNKHMNKQKRNSQSNYQPRGNSNILEGTPLSYKFCIHCERVSHLTNECRHKFAYCGKCKLKGHQRGQTERCKGSQWNHRETYNREVESKGAKPKYFLYTQENREESSEDERRESYFD